MRERLISLPVSSSAHRTHFVRTPCDEGQSIGINRGRDGVSKYPRGARVAAFGNATERPG